jgi:hypothetical protein
MYKAVVMRKIKVGTLGVMLISLLLLSLVPARAMADGVVIPDSSVSVYEPHQEAVIVWDEETNTETLVLSAALKSHDVGSMGIFLSGQPEYAVGIVKPLKANDDASELRSLSFEGTPERVISVVGTGKVSAAPDMVYLRLGVEAEDREVAAAQEIAAETMNKVIAALEERGIADKDIQTKRFSIDPVRVQRVVVGYRVRNMVEVKIRNVEGVGTIIDVATKAGGDLVRVEGVDFILDNPAPYYQEAREKAVKDAKDKAEQLAHLSGVELGEPVEISEIDEASVPIYRMSYSLERGSVPAPATPISPGELEVEVRINITYTIADR